MTYPVNHIRKELSLWAAIESAPLLSILFACSLVFLAIYNLGDPGPNYHGGPMVVFCNDASFGMQSAAQQQLPAAFTGKWNDLNWLGNEDVSPSLNMSCAIAAWFQYVAPFLFTASPICQFFLPIIMGGLLLALAFVGPANWRQLFPDTVFGKLLAVYFICFFGSAFIGLWNWPAIQLQ